MLRDLRSHTSHLCVFHLLYTVVHLTVYHQYSRLYLECTPLNVGGGLDNSEIDFKRGIGICSTVIELAIEKFALGIRIPALYAMG